MHFCGIRRFGRIATCDIIRDWKTGDSLQYGFIEFETSQSAETAYFKMQDTLIDDRRYFQIRIKGRAHDGVTYALSFLVLSKVRPYSVGCRPRILLRRNYLEHISTFAQFLFCFDLLFNVSFLRIHVDFCQSVAKQWSAFKQFGAIQKKMDQGRKKEMR